MFCKQFAGERHDLSDLPVGIRVLYCTTQFQPASASGRDQLAAPCRVLTSVVADLGGTAMVPPRPVHESTRVEHVCRVHCTLTSTCNDMLFYPTFYPTLKILILLFTFPGLYWTYTSLLDLPTLRSPLCLACSAPSPLLHLSLPSPPRPPSPRPFSPLITRLPLLTFL